MSRRITIEFLGKDKSVGSTIDGVESKSSRLGGVLAKVGKAAAVGLAAAGAATVKLTMDAAKLDAQQREVVSLFGETGRAAERSLGDVRSQVRRLSDQFGVAQETLTGGLYQAISAGVPRENAFKFMQVASKAAIAGVTDTETAVDGLTSIINAFGLESKDAGRVADSMFTTVKDGKTNFEQLSSSIFNIAPAAAAAKVSFQEVNAAVAALTAAGTPTSVATTQIRAALVGLQKPSADLNGIFQKLGFENAQLALEQKGLGFALEAVKKASKGNNGELQKLLGSTEAVAAANVLAGTGAEKFRQSMANQEKSAGATNKAFKLINDSVQRQGEIFKTQLRNIGLSVGQALLPHVNTALKAFNKTLLPGLMSVKSRVAPILSGLFDGLKGGGGGGTMAAVVGFGKSLLPVITDLGAKLKSVLGPGLAQIGALLRDQLLPAFREALPVIQPVAAFLLKMFGTALIGVISGAIQVVKGLLNVITGVFKLIKAVVTGEWGQAWAAIKQIAFGAFQAIAGAIKVWWNASILGVFKAGITFLVKGLWVKLWAGLKSLAASGMKRVGSLVKGGLSAIGKGFMAAVRGYANLWRGLFRLLWSTASAGWKALRSAFGGAMSALRTMVASFVGGVRSAFARGMQALVGAARSAWGSVRGAVSSGIGAVVGLVRSLPGKILGALGNLGRLLWNAGSALIQGLIDGISSKIRALTSKLGSVTKLIPKFKGPIEKDRVLLKPAGRAIMDGLNEGIESREPSLRRVLGGVTHTISGSVAPSGGGGGEEHITVVLQLDGREIHRSLVKRKRTLGTSLGLA